MLKKSQKSYKIVKTFRQKFKHVSIKNLNDQKSLAFPAFFLPTNNGRELLVIQHKL